MNLWELPIGHLATLKSFSSDLPISYQVRLQDLGFEIGSAVFCERWTPFGGPRVYRVCDSVFSLAKDIATFVELSEVVKK
jgi:Fe2+ transport system protein FeoA